MMALTEELVAHLATELLRHDELTYDGRDARPRAAVAAGDDDRAHRGARRRAGRRAHAGRGAARASATSTASSRRGRLGPGQARPRALREDDRGRTCGARCSCATTRRRSRRWPATTARCPGCVERFEAIVAGRELGNAFSELHDPDEQRATLRGPGRASRRPATRRRWSSTTTTSAPSSTACRPTGGLGIGIDRLVMLLRRRAPRSATSSCSRPCGPSRSAEAAPLERRLRLVAAGDGADDAHGRAEGGLRPRRLRRRCPTWSTRTARRGASPSSTSSRRRSTRFLATQDGGRMTSPSPAPSPSPSTACCGRRRLGASPATRRSSGCAPTCSAPTSTSTGTRPSTRSPRSRAASRGTRTPATRSSSRSTTSPAGSR